MKISRDVNGNKVVKVEAKDLKHYRARPASRGFSVQTLGNLPYTHRNDLSCLAPTKNEIFDFIKEYGTDRQKKIIGADNEYTLKNIIEGYTADSVLFKTELNDSDIDQLCKIIGGRSSTRGRVESALRYSLRSADFWGVADRFCYNVQGNRWQYFAGQDHTYEIPQVRKCLIK